MPLSVTEVSPERTVTLPKICIDNLILLTVRRLQELPEDQWDVREVYEVAKKRLEQVG